MADSYSFQIGSRAVNLDSFRTGQLLEANSAKEAYKTKNGGLWARFCDYFCLGSDRKGIRDLFNAISESPGTTDPMIQLARFEKLSSHIDAAHAGKFFVNTKTDTFMQNPNKWKYSLEIDSVPIYKSSWKSEPPDKAFCVKMTAFNIQQDVERLNGGSSHSRERYASLELEALSDIPGTKEERNLIIGPDERGTSRAYLEAHILDKFFCSSNFHEIKQVSTDSAFFDAVYRNRGEERVLRLSNRSQNNCEFRGEIAQRALGGEDRQYETLNDVLSSNYGTERDSVLIYIVAAHTGAMKTLIGSNHFSDSDVRHIFNSTTVNRVGADPVTLSALVYKEY
uniref:hypothetical protein n=1 Tax=Yersinia frederiksenii TaxID=29484 RepID=UPI001F4BCE44|nr:hypothetical protein [Yersinia frederiksenii]ULG20007.1 hypothetical protein 49p1_00309 [Yersinia frederiksenii]